HDSDGSFSEGNICALGKMELISLEHQVNTTPDYAMSVLWESVHKFAQRKLGINILPHTPEKTRKKVDNFAISILKKLNVDIKIDHETSSGNAYIINGKRVYWSNNKGGWFQDIDKYARAGDPDD